MFANNLNVKSAAIFIHFDDLHIKSSYRYKVILIAYRKTAVPPLLTHFDGLVQKRRNSIANALELHVSCIKPSIWYTIKSLI